MHYIIKSFYFAFNGMYIFFKQERNGKLQATIALFAIFAACFFKISGYEWLILLLCIGSVISLEMINSAIERICNMHTTQFNAEIKIIKDIAAGAVLWMSIISAVIGCILFIPHLIIYFK
ncbi:MAG: diacylglycerol kinase family protein [Chitinophagaceae bacterium]|nr:diacylglycerol kinase family protein [Chitinophagaceae bacterium]